MCRTLGWTLRTYLYGGWLATSGNGVRLNRKLFTTWSDSALESAGSRVMIYRPMTMAEDTSKVARRRNHPDGRFILQFPHQKAKSDPNSAARNLMRGLLPAAREAWDGCIR